LSVYSVTRFMDTRRPRFLFWALGLSALTAVTHLLMAGLLVLALPVAVAHWLWMSRADWSEWKKALWIPLLVAIPSVVYPIAHLLLSQPREPVLNPLDDTLIASLSETFEEALPLWVAVGVFAILALLRRAWPRESVATVAVGSSWIIVGILFFVVFAERRALLPMQVGLVIVALSGLEHLLRPERNTETGGPRRPAVGRFQTVVIATSAIAIVGGIVAAGIGGFSATSEWYRVVDTAELRGLDRLKGRGGDLVVASQGNSGIQIGWWVEGYVGLPTYSGLDIRFLTFPDEREQAQIANTVFSGQLTDAETRSVLEEIGADFIVVDRRGPDASWLDGSVARSLHPIFDSPTLVVLEVPSS